jgi:hypothetical protein
VLTLTINNVAQKEEATLMSCEDVAGSRRTQPPVDYLWSLVPSFLGLSVNSDNLPFSYVILFLYTLICHYNPGMHIGLHLVFFGKQVRQSGIRAVTTVGCDPR